MVDVHILVTINVYQEQKDSNCCINHIIKRRVDRYALNEGGVVLFGPALHNVATCQRVGGVKFIREKVLRST